MNEITQKVRKKYPQYADLSDHELTRRIGDKYPVYLDGSFPKFEKQFGLLKQQSEAAKRGDVGTFEFLSHPDDPAPKYSGDARTQGGLGLMEGVARLGEQAHTVGADTAEWNPLNLVAASVNAALAGTSQEQELRKIQESQQELAEEAGFSAQQLGELRQETGGPKVIGDIMSGGTSLAPTVLAGPGGMPLMAIAAGAQSYGATRAEAAQAYEQQGMQPKHARQLAQRDALESGFITSLITAGFGKTGAEALAKLGTGKAIAGRFREFVKQAGLEGIEEGADQALQSVLAKAGHRPDLTLGQAAAETRQAAGLGMAIGGTANVPRLILPDGSINPERLAYDEQNLQRSKKSLEELKRILSQQTKNQEQSTKPDAPQQLQRQSESPDGGVSPTEEGGRVEPPAVAEPTATATPQSAPADLSALTNPDPAAGLNTFPIPEEAQTKLDELVKANRNKAEQPAPVLKQTAETVNKEGGAPSGPKVEMPVEVFAGGGRTGESDQGVMVRIVVDGEERGTIEGEIHQGVPRVIHQGLEPEQRGRGYATKALEVLLDKFRQMGFTEVQSDSSVTHDALKVYDRLSDRFEVSRNPEAKPDVSPDGTDVLAVTDTNQGVLRVKLEGAPSVPEPPASTTVPRGKIGMKLSEGDKVATVSGRLTTPFPKVDVTSARKANATIKRVDRWLFENALAEAISRGDKFNRKIFGGLNPERLSQSDKDSLEAYLFADDQPPVLGSILKPLSSGSPQSKPISPPGDQTEATITGSNEQQGSEMPAEAGATPAPSSPQYQRGQTLVLSPFGRFKYPQNVKFLRQDDFGAFVYLPKSEQYLTVDPGLLSLPRAVATQRANNAELAKLPAEQRKQAKADAKEFDRLLREEGPAFGFYDANVELDTSARGQKAKGAELKRARVRALKELGAEIPENSTTLERAKALPALRKLLADETRKAEQAQRFDEATEAGAIDVLPAMLEVGDKLVVEGTDLKVIEATENSVTLENGLRFGVQQISPDEVIYVEEIDKEENVEFADDPGEDPFALDVLDDAQFDAEQEKVRQQQEQKAREEEFERQKHARLTGDTGDLGQGDMFGQQGAEGVATDDVDLLSTPAPATPAPSSSPSTPKPTGKAAKGTKATTKASGQQWPGPAPEAMPTPEPAADPSGESGGPDKPAMADDRNHSSLPFGLPELVQLAKGLGKGRYPKLKKRLRALRGAALGVFRYREGDPASARIELRQDNFQMITEEERAEILRRAELQADAAVPGTVTEADGVTSTEFTNEQIDERNRIIQDYYTGEIEQLKAERLEQEPVLASKVLAHEIGHWIDYLPQAMIAGRGNLLGRIASLKSYLKHTLPRDPNASGDKLLTMKDRARLRRAAERENGPRPKNDAARKSWSEAVKESYQAKVKAEIEDRGLMSLKELKEELRPLITWYQGADSFPEYFDPSEEMYAEAFSVFLTNPAAMAKRAPKYFNALIDYMERKPEVAAIYDKIQNEIRTGAIHDTRARNLLESFDKDTEAWRRRVDLAENEVADSWVDNIIYHFDRRFGPIYRRARGYKDQGRLKEAIGSFLYRGSEHELFLGRMNREVGQLLVDNNLDWKDFGAYLFHSRVINSEHDVANPLGFSPNSSREALQRMEQTLGKETMAVLEQAQRRFRKLYEDQVIPLLQSSGLVSPELQSLIEERVFYATFQAVRGQPETDIDALLDKQFGNGVGAGIYRRVGNLGEVANPATATVNKALSLISAAHRNEAKRQVVKMLQEQDPEMIREADRRWTGKRYEFVMKGKAGDDVQTMVVLEDGEPKAYYVSKYIAEAFDNGNPIENRLAVGFLKASRWVKSMFTQWNPGFWAVNYVRDAVGVYQQMPDMSARQYARLLPRALRAARASLKHKRRNKDAEHALRERVLISQSDPRGIKGDVADEYEFRLAGFGLDPAQWDKAGPKSHMVAKAWNWYREQGQSLERVHKIMGLIHLEEKFPDMPDWQKREIVRERAGSPDFLQRPASKAALDAFALFYTPWKEGNRSFAKAARQNPWQFAGKMTLTMALPTILQALAESGAFGEERKKMMESVSDYDATNYLVFPLGWEDEDQSKVKYLRLPLWEPARVLHGLMVKSLTGRGEGYTDFAGKQVPGMNPLFSVAANWATFAVAGKNPYDYFYEGNVLDQDKMAAGDASTWGDMLKHTWNSLGGGLLYRFQDNWLKQPDPTKLEKALKAPVVGPVVNRFLKVSNRGVIQADKKEIFDPVDKTRAKTRLAVKEILRKQLATEPMTDAERKLLLTDPYAMQYWQNSLPDILGSRNSFILDRLQRAPNKEARLKLLIKMMEEKKHP